MADIPERFYETARSIRNGVIWESNAATRVLAEALYGAWKEGAAEAEAENERLRKDLEVSRINIESIIKMSDRWQRERDEANADRDRWYESSFRATAKRDEALKALTNLCDWVENEVGVDLPFDARRALEGGE